MSNSEQQSQVVLLDYQEDKERYNDHIDEAEIVKSTRIIWATVLLLASLITWSYFAELVEVSTGTGKVVPTSREQVIQSLEGGILSELYVREGDIVEAGQILAQLDLTKTEANVGESAARYRATLASIARLEAEVNQTKLSFPEELKEYPHLIQTETRLYHTRKQGLDESIKGLNESLGLVQQELNLTRNLARAGAASNVEVLKLQRQVSEIQLKKTERKSEYMVRAREELAKAKAEADSLESVIKGRTDSLSRLTLRSPVRGIVKDVAVTTKGGVIAPNGQLMEIVPLDDQLLIEARISPRDVAFIYPGQEAKVKITAYDYSIYGGLEGVVTMISPDTIQDEVKPEIYYYRVFIRTETDSLSTKNGNQYPIVPGMIATVDIKTGEKTVFDYLMKPINKAKEALRER
ncbi:secretion protein HlyD [Thiopseudomonas alkaliphila]|uniref:HlyD family type I secretion periplasmic adaptor subunit n=1 Tax=Thiopseudomonas alkaliphila TaxID=1697053 RepID=UPI00069EDDD0|nr:HlyD family type I secretion periplasmic adaptor subunit [Thiopseudomonas alkaliphila]AKX44876.1 secretion protein HlyD [Thiopseudomonas alkaliphila]AKX55642.1 secretion protein HlyD [Thiopseudomonas alkaliphila]AKX55644.1 secretion protein HlyD [Thiopseudomonas alkaliphila]MDM1716470.1 HlyD family type I secretion periplasmic adaptor subunit [Thiopseudomonas alkaliphila]